MGAVVPFDPPADDGWGNVRLLPDGGLDYDTLPEIADTRLPAAYEAAKVALAECQRVDECKDWADKAAALATYARMADDETLLKTATRIRARAVRRVGELLEQIPVDRAANSRNAPKDIRRITRQSAMVDAGLSPKQGNTAIRVAKVPASEFEARVESDDPPSTTEMAQGAIVHRKPKPGPVVDLGARTEADFKAATALMQVLDHVVRYGPRVDLGQAIRGIADHERSAVADQIDRAIEWLGTVQMKGKFGVE